MAILYSDKELPHVSRVEAVRVRAVRRYVYESCVVQQDCYCQFIEKITADPRNGFLIGKILLTNNVTTKSSCVNARGVPPAPHIRPGSVMCVCVGGGGALLSCQGGTPFLLGGTVPLVLFGVPVIPCPIQGGRGTPVLSEVPPERTRGTSPERTRG